MLWYFKSSLSPRLDHFHHTYVLVVDLIGTISSSIVDNLVDVFNEDDVIEREDQIDIDGVQECLHPKWIVHNESYWFLVEIGVVMTLWSWLIEVENQGQL